MFTRDQQHIHAQIKCAEQDRSHAKGNRIRVSGYSGQREIDHCINTVDKEKHYERVKNIEKETDVTALSDHNVAVIGSGCRFKEPKRIVCQTVPI